MRVPTGVNLDKLIAVSETLKQILGLENLWSKLPLAGKVKH